MNENKTCKLCGKNFAPDKYHPYQKYCSEKCCYRARYIPKLNPNYKKRLEYNRNYHKDHQEEILSRKRNYHKNHQKERQKYSQGRRKERRLAVLNKLSDGIPKCNRCGFSDIRALQIDHRKGGGSAERKHLGSYYVHRKILEITTDEAKKHYQTLCANCNFIKRYEKGEGVLI